MSINKIIIKLCLLNLKRKRHNNLVASFAGPKQYMKIHQVNMSQVLNGNLLICNDNLLIYIAHITMLHNLYATTNRTGSIDQFFTKGYFLSGINIKQFKAMGRGQEVALAADEWRELELAIFREK
ncbi:hypothetical protein ACJX0J_034486, partial [Zea mays]